MQILLTGGNGQVGWELRRTLMPLGEVVVAERHSSNSSLCLDLADLQRIQQVIQEVRPQVIVNAAAYTAVDRAESEPELAQTVNGDAPGVMAEVAKQIGAALVHYSTDYVFDGTKPEPYLESDRTNPLSVYGKTKWAGEQAIQAVDGSHLILRTSWVYGLRGKNFLLTILKLSQEREELRIVDDQIGAPTWSRAIAETTAQILAQGTANIHNFLKEHSGLYHLTADGQTSWYGFAKAILDSDSDSIPRKLRSISPIPSQDYPTPAKRPTFSRLNNDKLLETFGLHLPDWLEMLKQCLIER
jgi:dTDP-4-dehydrorhamnose reductase